MPSAQKLSETRKDAIFIRVNGDDNIAFRDSFRLLHYPSIIGFYPNSNGNRFELMASDADYNNLNAFVNKFVRN